MKTANIHVLHTGQVYIDRALAFEEKTLHPLPFTGWLRPASKKSWVPVSSYLIEHPKGLLLIDTGWHEDMRSNPRKHLGRLSYSMFKGALPEGQSIREQLLQRGIRPTDLDYVVISHMHSDHISGVKHVAGAKKILTSELEWKAAHKDVGYTRSMWEGVDITPAALHDIPHGPYRRGVDLFQDGTLYLVHTPGHSRGQLSALVLTASGWVLLASDVGYAKASFEQALLPGIKTSREEAAQSLRWAAAFGARSDCAAVLANHDPVIRPHTIS
ncbi:N-acyl homoserine lactonase family protein [Paenibacillus thermotolerans]|uniref:N-acyl homoserine lactonase family protein n=1 Tax=Paenibacillus thermotolerans TaxID=3027807 RepID=UPI002367A1BC|nr:MULTISPECIES: N-acyl homoserine lactonase family protein [unclassified Paenibacillus]